MASSSTLDKKAACAKGLMGCYLLLVAWAVCCGAAQYTVGESNGWGLGNDLDSWVSQHSFHVGDDLYFPYPPGQHSVMLVSEEDYNKCNTENPIASDNGEGNMVITILSEETYFFICGVPGHCAQGLRLAVPVEPTPPSDDETPPTPPLEEAPKTPPHDEASPPPPPPTHDEAPPVPPDVAPPPPHEVEAPPHEDAAPSSQHSPPYYKEYNSFHPIANSARTCHLVIITFFTIMVTFLASCLLVVM